MIIHFCFKNKNSNKISEKKYTEYINLDTIKEMDLIEPDNDITNIFDYEMHKMYKYIESLGENVILNYKGNRIGVWEFFKFLPEEEKKNIFQLFLINKLFKFIFFIVRELFSVPFIWCFIIIYYIKK